MRAIHLVETREGKTRPVVVLTREIALPYLKWVTVAPITSTRRGIGSEVEVGPDNGIDHESVINCDNIHSVPRSVVGRRVGRLRTEQETQLTQAMHHAFALL